MAKYKNIYGGKEYLIHFKYSEFLNITYITMMYGIGIPLLFPVAALALINAYISERILTAWVFKMPPAMDNKLTKNALGMIKLAPLFLLFNGFWMVDNKQIFENVWSYVKLDNHPMPSHHYIIDDSPHNVHHSSPLAIMAAGGFILVLLQAFFGDILDAFGFTL
jgi:hypothetical protein